MSTQRRALLTLVGISLLHFAAGIAVVWGNAGIYVLSYFHYYDSFNGSLSTSFILLAAVIPFALIVLFATKFIKHMGFENSIRLCAVVLVASQLPVYLSFNLITMTIFYMILPTAAIYVSMVPALNCLYSFYPQKRSGVNFVGMVSMGVGTIVWNLLFMYLCNPQNEAGVLGGDGNVYFPREMMNNFPENAAIIFLICSGIFLCGAVLIRKKDDEKVQQIVIHMAGCEDLHLDEDIQNKILTCERMISHKAKGPPSLEDPKIVLSRIISEKQQITFAEAIRDKRCVLIFVLLFIIDIYPIYLTSNFKTIFLPTINNDHFLGYCLILYVSANMLGTIFWEYICKKHGIAYSVLIVVTFALGTASLGFLSSIVPILLLFMAVMGFSDRGVETIAGPGLVQIYNLKLASELIPFRGVSLALGFIVAPSMEILTSNVLSPFKYLQFLFTFSVISFFIGLYYFLKFPKKRLQAKKRILARIQKHERRSQEFLDKCREAGREDEVKSEGKKVQSEADIRDLSIGRRLEKKKDRKKEKASEKVLERAAEVSGPRAASWRSKTEDQQSTNIEIVNEEA